MLEDALAGFESQIQAAKWSVLLFQHVDDPQRLQIVLKTTISAHAVVQRTLSGVPEGRMPQVMRQRDGLRQILVERKRSCHGARDLCNFNGVRQARAEHIAL